MQIYRRFVYPLALSLLLVFFSACDAMSPNADAPPPSDTPGTFSARLSGVLNHSVSGTVSSSMGRWNGEGFNGLLPLDPCDDEDDDWAFLETECAAEDTTEAVFFLELMPDGDNPQEEYIVFMYDGEILPGTYRIADPDIDSTLTDADDYVFAEYMRMPTDSTLENYFATSGTLTISALADGRISGSFTFTSTVCFCASISDLEALFEDEDDLDEEEAEALEDALFEQFLEDRSLTITGDFTDVPLTNDPDFLDYDEDHEHDEDCEEDHEDEEEDDEDEDDNEGNGDSN